MATKASEVQEDKNDESENGMTWILAVVSLFGNVLNSRKSVLGFYVWILCNIGWLVYDIKNGIYARVVLDIVQTILCMYGIKKWGEKDYGDK